MRGDQGLVNKGPMKFSEGYLQGVGEKKKQVEGNPKKRKIWGNPSRLVSKTIILDYVCERGKIVRDTEKGNNSRFSGKR